MRSPRFESNELLFYTKHQSFTNSIFRFIICSVNQRLGETYLFSIGTNPQQQADAMKGCESEKYNILVSTSVLEEGIDIQKCNMVVRYMYVKDMIAKIQSRGETCAISLSFIFFLFFFFCCLFC